MGFLNIRRKQLSGTGWINRPDHSRSNKRQYNKLCPKGSWFKDQEFIRDNEEGEGESNAKNPKAKAKKQPHPHTGTPQSRRSSICAPYQRIRAEENHPEHGGQPGQVQHCWESEGGGKGRDITIPFDLQSDTMEIIRVWAPRMQALHGETR